MRDLIIEQLAEIENLTLVGHTDTEVDAVERLRSEACDIVILDIKLRQGSGIGVLRTLAIAQAPTSRLQKIIFSNYVEGEFRQTTERHGARCFFDKASEFPRLLALLKRFASEWH